MTEHDDMVAKLADRLRGLPDAELYGNAYNAIKAHVESPVAFSNIERLDRIRAVIEAVEAVRAERG